MSAHGCAYGRGHLQGLHPRRSRDRSDSSDTVPMQPLRVVAALLALLRAGAAPTNNSAPEEVAAWAFELVTYMKGHLDTRADPLGISYVLGPNPSSLCVPAKAGSTAYSAHLFRQMTGGEQVHPLTRGKHQTAEVARGVLFDWPRERRGAIVRNPVERVVSSYRAGRVFDEEENRGVRRVSLLEFARNSLYASTRLPCEEARLTVNQHWRSQRCFCGFEIPQVFEQTRVLPADGPPQVNVALVAELAGDASLCNEHRYGPNKNQTAAEYVSPRHMTKHSTGTPRSKRALQDSVGAETWAVLVEALRPDLEFFRDLWPPPWE